MDYREVAPRRPLQPLVRCFWSLSAGRSELRKPEPALPDGSPELIFNFGDPFCAIDDKGASTEQPLLMLVGQITKPFTVVPMGRIDIVSARFRPHGAQLVCENLAALTDTWVDGAALKGLALEDRYHLMKATPDVADRIEMLGDWLGACMELGYAMSRDVAVEQAVQAIDESHGTVSLDELADELRISPRQLQRRFAVQVGIPPKLLARIRRFQRVFSAWREDPSSLSRVALECGYFDQSHLIRDFRDFAGKAPAAFLANQPEFTQLFLPTNRIEG